MDELFHDCPQYEVVTKGEPSVGYGTALSGKINYVAGFWVADNEEYSIAVRFCPWCGVDLMTLLPEPKPSVG